MIFYMLKNCTILKNNQEKKPFPAIIFNPEKYFYYNLFHHFILFFNKQHPMFTSPKNTVTIQ